MQAKTIMAAVALLVVQTLVQAQTTNAPPTSPATQDKKADTPKPVQSKCRNVPLQRTDAKVTREDVLAEMQRARREGELDWHISGNPPAVQRRPCMPGEVSSGG